MSNWRPSSKAWSERNLWAPTCPGAKTTWLSQPRSTKRSVSCSWARTAQCRSSGWRAEAPGAHTIPMSRRAAKTPKKEARPVARPPQYTVLPRPGALIPITHRPSGSNTRTTLQSGLYPHQPRPAPLLTACIHFTLNSPKSEKEPAFSLSPLSSRRTRLNSPVSRDNKSSSGQRNASLPRTIDFPDTNRAPP